MTTETAIEANEFGCRLNGRGIFAHLRIKVRAGSFVGVFGANGAGKTTLFRALLGLVPAHYSSLRILGTDIRRARRQIGYVSQREAPEADGALSAASFVAAAWRGERWGWSGSRRDRRRAVTAALSQVEATPLTHSPLDTLSGGQRQRVRIAQSLINPVRMLFLDEPLNNLDPRSQQQLLELTSGFCRTQEMTVLMTGHDINPLLPYMDHVLYLADGRGHFCTVDDFLCSSLVKDLHGNSMRINGSAAFVPALKVHCDGKGDCSCS
jgi:zinc/manganese transport system ATP-binding protein